MEGQGLIRHNLGALNILIQGWRRKLEGQIKFGGKSNKIGVYRGKLPDRKYTSMSWQTGKVNKCVISLANRNN